MVAHEAQSQNPEKQIKVPEIPKSREIFAGDINDAVIAVQQITGFEITPDWWMSEVGNFGATEDILDRFDDAFENLVLTEMGIESDDEGGNEAQVEQSEIIAEAESEINEFDNRFADDIEVLPLRPEFIDDLKSHLERKYNLTDMSTSSGDNAEANVAEGDVEQPEHPGNRIKSNKKKVKKVIEQLIADGESETESLHGIMVTNRERDEETLPNKYVEHKAERTAIAAAVIKEATGSLVEELSTDSDSQPAFEFKFESQSDKPDKIEGLFDDIEELFKSVGQKIDQHPGNLERVAERYLQISENFKGTTFPKTIGETVSQGGPTIRTVFEDVVREVQIELSDRKDSDKESKRQFTLNALNSALKIRGFNLGHIHSVVDTPSQSLKEYIHRSPDGVTIEGLPPKPENGLFGETLGCPASLATDSANEFSMLDIYARSVVEAMIARDII